MIVIFILDFQHLRAKKEKKKEKKEREAYIVIYRDHEIWYFEIILFMTYKYSVILTNNHPCLDHLIGRYYSHLTIVTTLSLHVRWLNYQYEIVNTNSTSIVFQRYHTTSDFCHYPSSRICSVEILILDFYVNIPHLSLQTWRLIFIYFLNLPHLWMVY